MGCWLLAVVAAAAAVAAGACVSLEPGEQTQQRGLSALPHLRDPSLVQALKGCPGSYHRPKRPDAGSEGC